MDADSHAHPSVSPAPPITTALVRTGSSTLGHETNLLRAPLWETRPRPLQLDLIAPSILYGREFHQVAGATLTLADQRLYAELTNRYVRAGCPDHRRVEISLGEAARILGHTSLGGVNRQLVREALIRLRSVTVESAMRAPDGHEEVMGWGLIDWYRTTTRGGGRGSLAISQQIAYLLNRGSVTFLHAPTWDAIAAEDALAGRLWSFLEAENLISERRYQLFAAPPGQIAEARNLPAIAELLRLHWAARSQVAKRVRRALTVIAASDSRYQVALVRGKREGMWRLEALRTKHLAAPPPQSRLAPDVLAAWREAYGHRRASRKQIDILVELTERRHSSWVAARLSAGYPDPFGALLELDTAQRASDHEAILARERAWDHEKKEEELGAARLGDLLSRIVRPRTDED